MDLYLISFTCIYLACNYTCDVQNIVFNKQNFFCLQVSVDNSLFFSPQQLSHIPSDCTANFDFSRKGLLVFTDGASTSGNAHRSTNNQSVSGLFPWTTKLGNEDFSSIMQQMAQVKLYLVMGIFSFISPIIGWKRNLHSLFLPLKCVALCFVSLCVYILRRN